MSSDHNSISTWDLTRRRLKDDLLLRSIREWVVDAELEGIEDSEHAAIETRAAQAVGRRQVLDEEVAAKRNKLRKLKRGMQEAKGRMTELVTYTDEVSRPIFEWDYRISTRWFRVRSTKLTELIDDLETDGTEREQRSLDVVAKLGQAQNTSAELLERLRAQWYSTKQSLETVGEEKRAQLYSASKSTRDEQHHVHVEIETLDIVNKEQKFHLKRGSNYKMKSPVKPTPAREDTVATDPSPMTSGDAFRSISAVVATSPPPITLAARLSRTKMEEVEYAERILEADREALKKVAALVHRRRSERDALVRVRDALLREVDSMRRFLMSGAAPVYQLDLPAVYSFLTRRSGSPIPPHRLASRSPAKTSHTPRSPTPPQRGYHTPSRIVGSSPARTPSARSGRTQSPAVVGHKPFQIRPAPPRRGVSPE